MRLFSIRGLFLEITPLRSIISYDSNLIYLRDNMLHNPVITDMQTEISIMMNYTHQFHALNTFI